MSELRRDPVLGHWHIVAEERRTRPDELGSPAGAQPGARVPCPFCEGRERETPAELAARRAPGTAPDTPGWRVRVVPNLHPAVRPEIPFPHPLGEPLPDVLPGFGRHEVIVASPRHLTSLSELDDAALADVLQMIGERMRAAAADARIHTISAFHNRGGGAGASLSHVHAQLLAVPVALPRPRAEVAAAQAAIESGAPCPWCAMLQEELRAGLRVLSSDPELSAFCPRASRTPFETWLLPSAHHGDFAALGEAASLSVARRLRRLLTALEAELPDVPYNLAVHSAPPREPGRAAYHWRIELLPRVTRPGGFEWATCSMIDPVAPEHAAAALRSRLATPAAEAP